ncbi:transcription antitermination protein NusB [Bacteroidota bacterium]
MISRRLLRIKVLQILYSYFQKDDRSIPKSEKELFYSINKTHELYIYLLLLIIDIVEYAGSIIELGKHKHIRSHEDTHPNTRFIDNKLVDILKNDEDFLKYISVYKLSWADNYELVKNIYRSFSKSEVYNNYMNLENCDFKADKYLILDLLDVEFLNNELLHQTLEEKNIYWNDDLEFVVSIIQKALKKLKPDSKKFIPELFKDKEDKKYARDLFRMSVLNYDTNMTLIEKYTDNWDIERIAFMDIIIMQLAITEIIEIKSIPVKVSLNEYIEISKYYSTLKSSIFINGILDKIILFLRENKKINKTGRGLIGEI